MACASPQRYSALSQDAHSFAVRALNSSGVPDPTPAQASWTIDTTPPRVAVSAPGDGTSTNDRPTSGRDDATRPILSPLDSRGVAIRNGLNGERKVILDGRAQYVWRIQRYQVGLFLEIYNLTNHVNFGNPLGTRNSSNFLIPTVTDDPRTAQLGFRLIF